MYHEFAGLRKGVAVTHDPSTPVGASTLWDTDENYFYSTRNSVDDSELLTVARTYSGRVQAATASGTAAEPEAQLTTPVDNLLTSISRGYSVGYLTLMREAQLDGVRPDFAAMMDKKPCGWIELKAPGHTLDGSKWRGREAKQWTLLAQLDSLIVTDGKVALLYCEGVPVADPCPLPFDDPDNWDPAPLVNILELFKATQATPIKRVSHLAARLAPLARLLRMRLDEGLEHNVSAVAQAKQTWDATVHATTSSEQFASDVAQVISYAMAIAGLTGQADRNNDGTVTLQEAKETLEASHRNVLAASLGPVIGLPGLMEYIGAEVGAITRLISSLDVPAINDSKDSRGEPWLWFYEDFLAAYDPEARERAGVYYTPTSVVNCQVRIIDDLLRNRFDQTLGFGSTSVTTLDPATGSGTYPLAVINQAVETAFAERGPAGSKQVAKNLTKNVMAFELLPGPYAVAQLRIGQRLAEAQGQLMQVNNIGVYLTDTLEDPNTPMRTGLFGDSLVLAEETQKARRIKKDQQITVALGNPPYDRVEAESSGGWLMDPRPTKDANGKAVTQSLFDDVIGPAKDADVIFSAQASLYNLYVYFWRWAIWKVFQSDPKEKSIISFITASSWLSGPAFIGLRKLAVETASEIWVLDLGGEGRGARKEENVFDIKTPVAIVTLIRTGKASKAATVRYRRVRGTRNEKFAELDALQRLDPSDNWDQIDAAHGEPFIPVGNDKLWSSFPLLADLFPWQQPGIKYNRLWPVAPSKGTLQRRWKELLRSSQSDERAEKFVTSKTGRNIYTKVSGLEPLASLDPTVKPQPVACIGWRSFDRQWTFDDPRLINLERPALWQSVSDKQVFLVSPWSARISNGPAASVSAVVPDLHYFNNRGGKDVIPLYRDAEAQQPNVTNGLLALLGERYGVPVTPEDFLAYCYAVIGHAGYSEAFNEQLENSPVRVPLTASAALFTRAVELGKSLLWLHTYGERFTGADRPARRVPRRDTLGWEEAVTTLPATPKEINYDPESWRLTVGDGVITGVSPDVRSFEVSGMNIIDKWLGARTGKGIGRAASKTATPLDKIRPTEWEDEWNDELLDLLRVISATVEAYPEHAALLEEVVSGELIVAEDLPEPTKSERTVPKTIHRTPEQLDLPSENI